METEYLSELETEQLREAAEVLKAVAHPTRLQIIDLLEKGEKTVKELCELLGTPQSYTSQQLNLMKSKGVLSSRRDGNQVYYTIANFDVVKVIHCIRQSAKARKESST